MQGRFECFAGKTRMSNFYFTCQNESSVPNHPYSRLLGGKLGSKFLASQPVRSELALRK